MFFGFFNRHEDNDYFYLFVTIFVFLLDNNDFFIFSFFYFDRPIWNDDNVWLVEDFVCFDVFLPILIIDTFNEENYDAFNDVVAYLLEPILIFIYRISEF